MDVWKTGKIYEKWDEVTDQETYPELFNVLGFYTDAKGIYHAKQSGSVQSLEGIGYNNFYDSVFNCATNMDRAKFDACADGFCPTIADT